MWTEVTLFIANLGPYRGYVWEGPNEWLWKVERHDINGNEGIAIGNAPDAITAKYHVLKAIGDDDDDKKEQSW